MRNLVFLSITILLMSCSGTKNSVAKNIPDPEISYTEAMADSLWVLRVDTASAHQALHIYKDLVAQDTNSLRLSAKLTKAYYFVAQYLTQRTDQKDSLFMCGYDASQSVLNNIDEYRQLLFSTGDETMAILGLDLEAIESLYWGLANYGQWLSTKGALVRLGQRDLHWATLEHIHDLDSNFYYGAYYRYKGPLLAHDPATQADTLAIRTAFEKAIEIAPDYLGNYTLMAMYYCRIIGDKDLFYRLMTQVITSQPDSALPYYPENVYEKELAERLMVRAEKEKWF